jgi:hypothetical protein
MRSESASNFARASAVTSRTNVAPSARFCRYQHAQRSTEDFGLCIAEEALRRGVPATDRLVHGEAHDRIRAVLDHCRGVRRLDGGLADDPQCAARFQGLRRDDREFPQDFALCRRQLARTLVDDAERADDGAAREGDRRSSVEPDVRRARDERIVGKAGIERGIRYFEQRVASHGVGAKRHFPRGSGHSRETVVGLEHLAICVDEADQGNRHVTGERRGAHERVQLRLRVVAENAKFMQRGERLLFIVTKRCGLHDGIGRLCALRSTNEARGAGRQNSSTLSAPLTGASRVECLWWSSSAR